MGRPKKDSVESTTEVSDETEKIEKVDNTEKNNAIKKKLEKDFGNIFLPASFILNKKRLLIPVSPKLDIALGGGIPSGVTTIISGRPKLGKSSLALKIVANAQKQGMKAYYCDVENRLEKRNLECVRDLDINEDKFQVIRSSKDKVLSSEDNLTIMETLLKNEEKIIIVVDSASALCSSKEYDAEMTAQSRNDGPKLLASWTRKLSSIIPAQDSIVVIIQHLIANTGYTGGSYEDGGNKIIYSSDVKLRGSSFTKWENGTKHIGQLIHWSVIYSALSSPGAVVDGYLRFNYGVDNIFENIELGIDLGIISKSGIWLNTDFSTDPKKFQGQHKLWDYLSENPKDLELLELKIKENFSN